MAAAFDFRQADRKHLAFGSLFTRQSEITDYWTGMDLGKHEGDYTIQKMPGHFARLLEVKTSP